MITPAIDAALRAHADSLQITADAVRDAADVLAAGGSPTAVLSGLNLSALNAVSTALGIARRIGQIEALAAITVQP